MKRLIHFLTVPFFLIGCGTSPDKIVEIKNADGYDLQVSCKTGKIKFQERVIESMSIDEKSIIESQVKGITTSFIDPAPYLDAIEVTQYAFENQVKSACKK